jgi:hypothetical protein
MRRLSGIIPDWKGPHHAGTANRLCLLLSRLRTADDRVSCQGRTLCRSAQAVATDGDLSWQSGHSGATGPETRCDRARLGYGSAD